jgi:hypothetical protein
MVDGKAFSSCYFNAGLKNYSTSTILIFVKTNILKITNRLVTPSQKAMGQRPKSEGITHHDNPAIGYR